MEENPPPINTPQLEMAQQKSSNILLYLAITAVAIAFVGVGYFYFQGSSTKEEAKIIKQDNSQITETAPSGNTTDTSDQQLDKDVKSLDKSISSFNTDISDIDKSINEQQVNLQ